MSIPAAGQAALPSCRGNWSGARSSVMGSGTCACSWIGPGMVPRRRESRLSAHMETATYTTQLEVKTAVLFSPMMLPSTAATPMATMPAAMCNPLNLTTNKE